MPSLCDFTTKPSVHPKSLVFKQFLVSSEVWIRVKICPPDVKQEFLDFCRNRCSFRAKPVNVLTQNVHPYCTCTDEYVFM